MVEKKAVIGRIKYYCGEYIYRLPDFLDAITYSGNDGIKYNQEKAVEKIKSSADLHEIVHDLVRLHDQRLMAVEGYHPILRYNKKNLKIHSALVLLASVHEPVQYCELFYRMNNNKFIREELKYTDDFLTDKLQVLLQNDKEQVYQRLTKTFQEINAEYPGTNIHNSGWERKCQ